MQSFFLSAFKPILNLLIKFWEFFLFLGLFCDSFFNSSVDKSSGIWVDLFGWVGSLLIVNKFFWIMQAVNFFFVNALLFASLIAVVGVPVLYVTQPSTEEGQKESRRKIYSIAAVWVVLVFLTGIVSSLVWT